MVISYEDAVKAQTAIEDKLLEDPNVVSVGVIEEINERGIKTGSHIIKVGVISVEVYQNALKHGEFIPHEYVLHSENNQQETKHIQIKVVKTG